MTLAVRWRCVNVGCGCGVGGRRGGGVGRVASSEACETHSYSETVIHAFAPCVSQALPAFDDVCSLVVKDRVYAAVVVPLYPCRLVLG